MNKYLFKTLVAFLAISVIFLHAQNVAASSTAPDSIVQLTAQAEGLALVPPEEVPAEGAAFWIVTSDGVTAPWPFFPSSYQGAPTYAITSNVFLVDATGGQVNLQALGATTTAEAVETLAGQVEKVITQTQTAVASQSMQATTAGTLAMDGGLGNFAPALSFSTNSLWLEMTGVSDETAFFNLHNATDQVYAVWSTTNLSTPFADWQVESEVWPTAGTVMPWTLALLNRDTLFLRAEDWTGVTANGNQTPCWWFYYWFGPSWSILSDNSLDGNGHTLLSDYQSGSDPTVVNFSIQVTNNYVNTSFVPLQLAVRGIPCYRAILVDDTNLSDANWTLYTSSNCTVNLGPAEGWHNVWVGLKAYSSNSYVAWVGKRFKLDLTPPWLTTTNPVTNVISQPMIELQGYSVEPLANVTYDITNALGLVTNQQVLVLNQFYDTNVWDYTTNTFQAFDMPLTNGLNVITLHARDLAGNVMTTNFSYTLDYSSKTNPPVVQFYWPQNGTAICGSTFTWRGWIGDFTATVTAQMVDSDGKTNIFDGVVERDGDFWIENLPVGNGTNTWTLTVTDAAGNVAQTNITVSAGDAGLTIDPVSNLNQLWDPTLTVTGTISNTTDYTVWVNGMKAAINADGTWIATNVPLPLGGTAVIQARAIPNSENGGNGTGGSGGGPVSYDNLGNPDPASDQDTETAPNRPARLYLASYAQSARGNGQYHSGLQASPGDVSVQSQDEWQFSIHWADAGPDNWGSGSASESHNGESGTSGTCGDSTSAYTGTDQISWPSGTEVGTATENNGAPTVWTNYGVGPDGLYGSEHCQIQVSPQNNFDDGLLASEYLGTWCAEPPLVSETTHDTDNHHRQAQATWILETGGKGVPGRENLWQISGSADDVPVEDSLLYDVLPYLGVETTSIPSQEITIMGRSLDANGSIYVNLPIDVKVDVTPVAIGHDFYTLRVGTNEYNLYITANSVQLDPDRVVNGADFCVGKHINFNVVGVPGPYDNTAIWSLSGTFVNEQPDPNCDLFYDEDSALLNRYAPRDGTISTYCWYVSKELPGTVSVHVAWRYAQSGTGFSTKVTGKFNVHRPTTTFSQYQDGTPTVMVTNGVLSLGWNRDRDMSFGHQIQTDNVTSGQAGYVQLISGSYTQSSTGNLIDLTGTELDARYGEFPRGQPSIPANANSLVTFWDGPGVGLHQGNAQMDEYFYTYLMFRPNGGIWVPLRLVTWTLDDESDNYVLTKGNPVNSPSDNDCTTFPHWQSEFTGFLQ